MNSKTTLILALLLVALGLGYFLVQQKKSSSIAPVVLPPGAPEPGIAQPLLTEALGAIEKVAVHRGNDVLEFARKAPREGGDPVWHLIKPVEFKAVGHEIDRIARELMTLKFEVSHKPGDESLSEKDAGLAPPVASITLTDAEGKTVQIEIGKPASESETYVRKVGDDSIAVAKANLRKLLKQRTIEYRDQQLWNFPPEHATHAEVCESQTDGTTSCQSLVRKGGGWEFERPFAAKATTKVDDMIKAFARMRVSGWHDDDPSKLKTYGLDPGALQISVTVEETVPASNEDTDKPKDEKAADAPAEEPATEKRTSVYKLQVADRGPIGEDAKVFARSADDSGAGIIFKTATDKLRPVLSEWRDMRVIMADVMAANRIEIHSDRQDAVLVQSDGKWTFESGPPAAENHAVTELLSAISNLKAVSFLEESGDAAPKFDAPQVDIRLTIPGAEGVRRVTVGPYTDADKKLLVFVRSGEAGPIAKVRSADVSTLLRPPGALRDHTVFSVTQDAIGSLVIRRMMPGLSSEPQRFALVRDQEIWSFAAPSSAIARQDEVQKLITLLANLKATAVIAEAAEASAYGLQEPAIALEFSVAAPIDDDGKETPSQPAKQLNLELAEHDGKIYGKCGETGPIYEIGRAIYDQLMAEYRSNEVLDFDPKSVRRLTLRIGGDSNSFARRDGKWIFESEPDFPIDATKVDKILAEALALRTDRYASYDSKTPSQFALEPAHFELSVELASVPEPRSFTLMVSEKMVPHVSTTPPPQADSKAPPAPQSTTANFAAISSGQGIFLLSSDAVRKVFLPFTELEKK